VILADSCTDAILSVLERYGIKPALRARDEIIPGSYWGESEAGLIGDTLYLRPDTPLHSVLHEACHFVCMNAERRVRLDRDAGGDYDEESAVCYLQILLADEFAGVGRAQMCRDMDAWGYTFRLGSAQAWFDQDADDARRWLNAHGIIDEQGAVTWHKRS
jgi:hypothetical protein